MNRKRSMEAFVFLSFLAMVTLSSCGQEITGEFMIDEPGTNILILSPTVEEIVASTSTRSSGNVDVVALVAANPSLAMDHPDPRWSERGVLFRYEGEIKVKKSGDYYYDREDFVVTDEGGPERGSQGKVFGSNIGSVNINEGDTISVIVSGSVIAATNFPDDGSFDGNSEDVIAKADFLAEEIVTVR